MDAEQQQTEDETRKIVANVVDKTIEGMVPILERLEEIDTSNDNASDTVIHNEKMHRIMIDVIRLIFSGSISLGEGDLRTRCMCAMLGHFMTIIHEDSKYACLGFDRLARITQGLGCNTNHILDAINGLHPFRTREDIIDLAIQWK